LPTILRLQGYRFFFYSNEHLPIHIHIEKENKTAKINLETMELVRSNRFNAKELKEIRGIVEDYKVYLKEKWNEYFDYN
jgi:hypothetical protein